MKLLISEKDSHSKWLCINQNCVFECHNEAISKYDIDNNSGWSVVLPKRDSKRSFHLRMKKKYINRKQNNF